MALKRLQIKPSLAKVLRQRLAEGWRCDPRRDDTLKLHPCLVDYALLSESEKEYDRLTALETLKTITALGYRLVKAN